MGYIVILELDSYRETAHCNTAQEKDEVVLKWTKALTESYWGRNTAAIKVYPDQLVEEHEFEIDTARSKSNNVFKIKSVI